MKVIRMSTYKKCEKILDNLIKDTKLKYHQNQIMLKSDYSRKLWEVQEKLGKGRKREYGIYL